MKRKGFWGQVRKNRTLLCMLLPALLYVVIFSYIPMFGITIAFKDYNYNGGILGSPWCGFKNFEYLKISGKLWALTRNTLLYNLAFIVFGIIFEVGFAVMLSEITKKTFKKVTQAFMFLPYFISWVVVSTIMLNIFGQNGVLSNVLAHFGIEDFSIYQQIRQWPVIMVAIRIWKQTGYGTVVYLAAIAGLSQEMFEAASIDGASIWQRIRHITLPSINGLARTLLIMQVISVFQILYEPMVLKNGGPNNASISLMMLVYRFAFRDSDFSGAAALSVMICIILIILSGLYMKVAKKKEEY